MANQNDVTSVFADYGLLVSSAVAIALLLLYVVITVSFLVQILGASTAITYPGTVLTLYTAIGGLVSALVVGVLAATPPGLSPSTTLVGQPEDIKVEWKNRATFNALSDQDRTTRNAEAQQGIYAGRKKWTDITVGIYLAAWFLCGFAALVVAVIIKPDISSVLQSAGTTWFGIAIGAVYAYFGIKPS